MHAHILHPDFKHKTLLCVGGLLVYGSARNMLQMPATPPAAVARDSTTTHYMDSPTAAVRVENKPFHLNYDRLVISVGAYSQSMNPSGKKSLRKTCISIQHSWREGECSFPKGCHGR